MFSIHHYNVSMATGPPDPEEDEVCVAFPYTYICFCLPLADPGHGLVVVRTVLAFNHNVYPEAQESDCKYNVFTYLPGVL